MANKPYKSTSYEPAQDIAEGQDGFLIEQPSAVGARTQKWLLFSKLKEWIILIPEFVQIQYNKQNITANTNQIANNKNEIDGHTVDINKNEIDINANRNNIASNDSDIATLDSRVDGNDGDISALQTKTPQSYKTTDTPTFADVVLTGLGAIKSLIQGLLDEVGQSLNPDDDVVFNSVNTDNVKIRTKKFTGTLDGVGSATVIPHGIDYDKIMGIQTFYKETGSSVWFKMERETYILTSTITSKTDNPSLFGKPFRMYVTYEA